jgi:hypothetical protein
VLRFGLAGLIFCGCVTVCNLQGELEASGLALPNVTIQARNALVEESLVTSISAGAREVAIY